MLKSQRTNTNVWLGSFILGLIIFIFLVWWLYFKPTGIAGDWVYYLPYLNCGLNSLTSIFLILGFVSIKNGRKHLHKRLMLTAAFCSAAFLVSYLIYHHYVGDTKFLGEGAIRYLYFSLLISHILLSMIQVPCILATFYFAFTDNFSAHKKAAKITFPIWLYVSITGVLIFFFLKAYS